MARFRLLLLTYDASAAAGCCGQVCPLAGPVPHPSKEPVGHVFHYKMLLQQGVIGESVKHRMNCLCPTAAARRQGDQQPRRRCGAAAAAPADEEHPATLTKCPVCHKHINRNSTTHAGSGSLAPSRREPAAAVIEPATLHACRGCAQLLKT